MRLLLSALATAWRHHRAKPRPPSRTIRTCL